MAQKGVVKSGEAFCLQCRSEVDREVERCPSCDVILDEEIKAFSCPRCNTVLPLGTGECSQCGMKFKAKTLRQRLARRGSEDQTADEDRAEERDMIMESAEAVETGRMSPEQAEQLRRLVDDIEKLAEGRVDLLAKMKKRHADEKHVLTGLRSADDSFPKLDLIESEVNALADDTAVIRNLHSEMLSIAGKVSSLIESSEMSDDLKAKELATKAMKMVTESGGSGADQSKAREDQLAKREEMVNRKIRGYASKRKELDDREAEIAARIKQLEDERAAIEQIRKKQESADVSSERTDEGRRAEAELVARISRLCGEICEAGDLSAADSGEDIEAGLTSIENTLRRFLSEDKVNGKREEETEEQETEMRQLLTALDQLLGKLPEDVIQQFMQSADYKLYERTLDRYKI